MAFDTFTNLKTALADYLVRTDLTSQIADFIHLTESMVTYGDLASGTEPLRVRQMETTSADNTPSSGDITLATDFLEMISVRYTATNQTELDYATPKWLQAAYPDTTAGTPRFYTIVGSTLSIRPTGSSDIDYDYYQQIPALADNETNWLLSAVPSVYLHGSLYHAAVFGALSREDGAAHLGLFKAAIDGLTRQDRRRAGTYVMRASAPVTP